VVFFNPGCPDESNQAAAATAPRGLFHSAGPAHVAFCARTSAQRLLEAWQRRSKGSASGWFAAS
jgi:hypothetical protein